jgi:hypothetical protein
VIGHLFETTIGFGLASLITPYKETSLLIQVGGDNEGHGIRRPLYVMDPILTKKW